MFAYRGLGDVSDPNAVIISRQAFFRMLLDTIEMYEEYQQVHGYTKEKARTAAALETCQGYEAELELRKMGL